MIRLVQRIYTRFGKPDAIKLTKKIRMVAPLEKSSSAESRNFGQTKNRQIDPRCSLRWLLANQIGKRLRLIARFRDFQHVINDVLL